MVTGERMAAKNELLNTRPHSCISSPAKTLAPCLLVLLTFSESLGAQPPPDPSTIPPPLTHYKGRRIATTMHSRGAPWLVRDKREQEERCSLVLANLGVKRGTTVCDIGCGNGYYTLQLAKMVGPAGRVLAVDIQPEMLKLLEERAASEEITNIEPILSELHDPKFPEGEIELLLRMRSLCTTGDTAMR